MSFLVRSIWFLFLIPTLISSAQHLCHSDQRDTLLELKNEFLIGIPGYSDPNFSDSLKTWGNKSDCCFWEGITCEAGNVIGLDLSHNSLYGQFKSNSSVFKLVHLRELNLSRNDFNNSPIPAEFDKLMELERLDLSDSCFSGQIPSILLQLTKLVSLRVSYYLNPRTLGVDGSFLHLLARNLRNLRELDLSYVNIDSEVPNEFANLQSLRLLHLDFCNLSGEFPSNVLLLPGLESISLFHNPNLRGNLPAFGDNNSLLKLNIAHTSFSGSIPHSIGSLNHLSSLTLTYSNFSGKIPFSLGNLSHLSVLDLSRNNLVGEIPSSIGNLKELTRFDVSYNKLTGNLPSSLFNSSKLRSLKINSNQFTDSLPLIITQVSQLEELKASDNSFTGTILSSLVKIPSLIRISLTYTQFRDFTGIGNISLLPALQIFQIEDKGVNKVGLLDLNVFSPLRKLVTLNMTGIPLSANITPGSGFPSHLQDLYLRDCNIMEFPAFIRFTRNLESLDLSNNKMKGQVPDWLWRLPKLETLDLSLNSLSGSLKASLKSQLMYIDLSSNDFQGPLYIPSMLSYFMVSKNNFTGAIPQSICGKIYLRILDLSNNNLHGSIPECLKSSMGFLSDLNLKNNSLSGSLPEIFMDAMRLWSLDVSHNQIEGKLPHSLIGCSSLQVLNVGNNRISDGFPFQLSSLPELQVLILRSNMFHGTLHVDGGWVEFPRLKIMDVADNSFVGTLPSNYFLNWTAMSSTTDDNKKPQYIFNFDYSIYYTSVVLVIKGVSLEMERVLTTYTALDLSGNQLQGQIPDSVGLLKELHIFNISNNGFTGHIPSSFANLTNLESLDLSQNHISGEIPPELGNLPSLAWINISHNQLEGSIPQGTQFQRQNCSSYEGNPKLNRLSLKDVCRDIEVPTPPQPNMEIEEDDDEEEESVINWVAVVIAFGPGIILGITIRLYFVA